MMEIFCSKSNNLVNRGKPESQEPNPYEKNRIILKLKDFQLLTTAQCAGVFANVKSFFTSLHVFNKAKTAHLHLAIWMPICFPGFFPIHNFLKLSVHVISVSRNVKLLLKSDWKCWCSAHKIIKPKGCIHLQSAALSLKCRIKTNTSIKGALTAWDTSLQYLNLSALEEPR